MTPAVLDRLQAIATGKVDGQADGAPIAEDRDAIAAAKLILAYGHGQPTQPVDLDPKAKPGAPETPMGRVLRLITTPPKRDGAT